MNGILLYYAYKACKNSPITMSSNNNLRNLMIAVVMITIIIVVLSTPFAGHYAVDPNCIDPRVHY